MDATTVDGDNTGLVERRSYIADSRIVEMMGRLHVDLFLQDRFLLNGVSVKIRLVRSNFAFSLMAGGQNPDYKVQIVVAVLFARKAVLSPTFQVSQMSHSLGKWTAKYPIRLVDHKVSSIPQGAMSHTHENLFLGTLPKRPKLWCMDNDTYNGEYSKNPFNAKNNATNFLAVYVDRFDLTPDGCDGGCFHLTRKGNLRIEMYFATTLEQTVNVVVYGEFQAVLEIDKGRNIIYNYHISRLLARDR